MKDECFVYEDWTIEDHPRCFYVGMGNIKRIKLIKRNKHHTNIVKKYGIDRRIVFGPIDREQAALFEMSLIKKHHTFVHDELCNIGTNYTLGGQVGTPGFRLSLDHRQKISSANSHPKSEETKNKMKLAAKERSSSVKWRKKMSEVSKGRKFSQETRQLISKSLKGRKLSKETKKKISKSLKGNPNLGKCNKRENMCPSRLKKLSLKSSKPVAMCDVNGNTIRKFSSINSAANAIGVTDSAISHVLHGRSKTCCGFGWKFIEKDK